MNMVGRNAQNLILPGMAGMAGMTVMAGIITVEKTTLEYFLKSSHVSLQTAFTER